GYDLCNFYEAYSRDGSNAEIPQGVYSLNDLKELGQEKGWCPYFLTRHLIHHATVLVYNYQYMLDPKVSNLVSRELEAESIVVFDEAHNIDNVCIEALSVTLDRRRLEASSRSVARLQSKVSEMKATDTAKLAKEYADLVHGLSQQRNTAAGAAGGGGGGGAARVQSAADQVLSNPVLSADILEEAVPGNIRKAEHFVAFLKKVVQFLKAQLAGADVTNRTPLAFLHDLFGSTGLERKPLRFTYTRLNSLLRTLEITSLDEFNALQEVANFATLVATYTEGFAVICEPQGSIVAGITEPLLQLCCLDASIAIKPVLDRFQSVVITSGTLSPIDLYPKLLNFQPVQSASLPMSTFRHCLLPLVVTRGSDQIAISTRFELRKDTAVIRNYGQLLIDIAAATPDGICCFFTSYQYMEFVIGEWDKMQILQRVLEHKLIYLETKDVVETTLALDNYKRACDCGRGAVFLSVARGKVAEGIDFDRHYGRCVVIFGIPYQYTLSHVLRARLSFMREKYQIRDNDFLTFDALRQSAQCVGRVIRSKTDYGIVVLADSRYNRLDKRSKFPPWILQFMRESSLNLPTDAAVDQIKSFLRQMGQPIEQEALHSILLNEAQVA
ncbi:helicase C-terminal domain-containing protein, partial [Ochromonadaceae sp. CCMP2298]